MTQQNTERCRLVLVAPEGQYGSDFAEVLETALGAGDVASVILPAYGLDEAAYQRHLEINVTIAQNHDAAAIAVNDTRAFGRSRADGLHVDSGVADIGAAIEKFASSAIVGAGGAEARHRALEIGELQPDYVFFGRFGQDTFPDPHRKNVALADWWAGMVEIPCILMGGGALDSLDQAASTGAEFVALSRAVFGPGVDPHAAVAQANGVLEQHLLGEDA